MQEHHDRKATNARQAKLEQADKKALLPEKESRKKMSFKEKKEFEALETEIPALEAEKSALEEAMSSGTLTNDELLVKSARIAEVIDEIDEKTMRWLELSELL